MSSGPTETSALQRRERRGSDKQAIGIDNIGRMLPLVIKQMTDGEPTPRDQALMGFAPDMMAMMMEVAYCDAWGRTDVIDGRTRSLFTVSLMIGVGNVANEFELGYHAPGAIYNGATIAELEAIVVHAAAYVGYPAAGRAMGAIVDALLDHELLQEPSPPADSERRELPGSEKRSTARELLAGLPCPAPLLRGDGGDDAAGFAAELDLMVLEDVYYDLWTRTDVLDAKVRSIVTLGLIVGVGNLGALREHVPLALHHGVTVRELEELVYHAAAYVGHLAAGSVRTAIAEVLP
jgi:alkylhydroperoxidase/carboxymuconolactone decarboxylase family protein YurZ